MLVNAASDTEQVGEGVVQIWHRSNWHWYLKQEQVYPDAQGLQVCWDEVAALRLHVASGTGWYRQVRAPHHLLTVCSQCVSRMLLAGLGVCLLVSCCYQVAASQCVALSSVVNVFAAEQGGM